MKKDFSIIYIIPLVVTLLMGCGPSGSSFKINGSFESMKGGELYIYNLTDEYARLDTINVADGQFEYSGETTKDVVPYMLVFPNAVEQVIFVAAGQEILREGLVEEAGLVRDDVVEDGHGLAAVVHVARHVSQRGTEPRHPVPHDEQVGIPGTDGAGSTAVGERTSRIQESFGLYGYGFVVRCDILCLAREEEVRILPGEVEGLDIMMPAQFFEKVGVKLSYSPSVRVETGQYGYLQG